jgi:S1-C subfamily serine protease
MTIYAKHRFQSTVTSLGRVALFAALATTLLLASPDTNAQSGVSPGPQEVLEAVVGIDTRIPGTARTARTLGTQREGSGVVISDDGLVLTIGYLILEAIEIDIALADGRRIPASFVAYDHESGFGLVRAASDLGLEPVRFGISRNMGVSTQVLIANRLGPGSAQGVFVVDRREFVGTWEYLLDSAIFTSPPTPISAVPDCSMRTAS